MRSSDSFVRYNIYTNSDHAQEHLVYPKRCSSANVSLNAYAWRMLNKIRSSLVVATIWT